MTEESKKWVEIGLVLEKNPTAKLKCPHCGIGDVIVTDKVLPNTNKTDRYLICDNCKSWNVITMNNTISKSE